jgi:serine/threonine-protein kinase
VLYEALTGWPAFSGAALADLMVAISLGRFDPASAVRPGLPRSVDGFFRKALAVDPAARFIDARTMAAAFREALAPRKPRWRWVAVAAGVAVAVVAATVPMLARTASPSRSEPAPPSGASAIADVVPPIESAPEAAPEPASPASTAASQSVAARPSAAAVSPRTAMPRPQPSAGPSAPPLASSKAIASTDPTSPRPRKEIEPNEIQ